MKASRPLEPLQHREVGGNRSNPGIPSRVPRPKGPSILQALQLASLESHRQLFEGADSGAPAPLYSPRLDGKAHFRKAGEDALERDRCLRPSKLETKAEMHAGAEGEVWVRDGA